MLETLAKSLREAFDSRGSYNQIVMKKLQWRLDCWRFQKQSRNSSFNRLISDY